MGGLSPNASSKFFNVRVQVGRGQLYPALHKLEQQELDRAFWG